MIAEYIISYSKGCIIEDDVVNYYKIEKKLGVGFNSFIYSAKYQRDNSIVAVKMIKTENLSPFFFKEKDSIVQNWLKLKHKNIVQIKEVYIDSSLSIVTELMEGDKLFFFFLFFFFILFFFTRKFFFLHCKTKHCYRGNDIKKAS